MKIWSGAAIAVTLAAQLVFASQAQAQAYISVVPIYQTIVALGNQPSDLACQQGEPFPAREVAFLQQQAQAVIGGYWSAVSSGQAPLASFIADKHTRWTFGSTVMDKKSLAAIKDLFAAPGSNLIAEPLGFKVAGDGLSAVGQWHVRDGAGGTNGTYHALFRNRKGIWLLSTLELSDAQTWVDPVSQYCHAPGDVLGYRIKHAREGVAFGEPRLTNARQVEANARAKAAKARSAAEAAPGNAGKQEAARAAAHDLAAAENTSRAYQSMVDKQRGDLAKAEADQLALEQQRAAGQAALSASP